MSGSQHSGRLSVAARNVPATFGRKQVEADPGWEWEFAAVLKEKHSGDELHAIFSRFSMGESAMDYLMRRIILRALSKHAGHGLHVGPGVVLKHPETMEFGDAVFIGAQAMIQGRYDGTCKIGNHVWIGPQAYFDARALVLEDYVGWGPGAKVLGSLHAGQPVKAPVITTDLRIKPVFVGYGADIGMNASILPGVRIGAQAIVGAGAVVTRDVAAYAIVAGVPARYLHSRLTSKKKPPSACEIRLRKGEKNQ